MKITAIRSQVKNPQRVSIFVDGKYGFSLSLDELVAQKLKNGQVVDAAELKRYKKLSEDGKLRTRSLEWLLGRPHSIREFKDYLYRKKAEPELSENLINEFSQKGYLDDAKFAQWFAELQSRRNKSNRQVRAELFKKGVSRQIVEEILQENDDDELERLKALATKKMRSSRYKNDPLKLKQYLARQGFSYDDINESLRNT